MLKLHTFLCLPLLFVNCNKPLVFKAGETITVSPTPKKNRVIQSNNPPTPSSCTATACLISSVPYFYQYNNPPGEGGANGGNTCQVTSLAMIANFILKKNIYSPKDFYAFRDTVKSPGGMAQILKEKLGYGWYTESGNRDQMKTVIRSGRPIALNNYFTRSGHVVVVIGYDAQGFIFNDPAGKWAGQAYGEGSYSGNNATEGKGVRYSNSQLTNEALGDAGGQFWFATGDIKPIALGFGQGV